MRREAVSYFSGLQLVSNEMLIISILLIFVVLGRGAGRRVNWLPYEFFTLDVNFRNCNFTPLYLLRTGRSRQILTEQTGCRISVLHVGP